MEVAEQKGCRYIAFADTPRDVPLVVVDLGYSARRKSCGLYWTGAERHEESTFGNSVRRTAAIVQSLKNPVLVVEAPLSSYHAASGNPDVRGEFERGRGWYHGAGASTYVGAVRFLTTLSDLLAGELLLAEAFLSNKDSPTGHGDDAVQIHNRFWAASPVPLRQGVEPSSGLIAGVPSVRVFLASAADAEPGAAADRGRV